MENNIVQLQRKETYRLRLTVALASLAAFCFIAVMVQTGRTTAFDHAVDYAVYSLRGPVANAFFSCYTHLGDAVCLVILLAVLALLPVTRWKIGIPAGVTGLLGVALFKVMKPLFARPRPDVSLHLISQGGYSFPSGHSMNGLICLGMIILLVWRCTSRRTAWVVTLLLTLEIVGIGFSRIFVGVHYITDVLGGYAIGLAFLMAASLVMDRVVLSRIGGGLRTGRKRKAG